MSRRSRRLRAGHDGEAALRRFEVRLLALIGYGLNLSTEADTGRPVRDGASYHFQPGVHGVVLAHHDAQAHQDAQDRQDAHDRAAPVAGEVLRRLATGAGSRTLPRAARRAR